MNAFVRGVYTIYVSGTRRNRSGGGGGGVRAFVKEKEERLCV